MLEEVAHLLELEILEPPYALNFVLHTPTQGGTRGTPANLMDLVARLADLPVPRDQLRVTVTSMGATQLPDHHDRRSRWGSTCAWGWRTTSSTGAASRCASNAQLVERTVRIARRAGPPPGDARRGARAARHPRAHGRCAGMNRFAGLQARAAEGRPIRVGLIGAGAFGAMYAAQARRTPGVHLAAVADLDPAQAAGPPARRGLGGERLAARDLPQRSPPAPRGSPTTPPSCSTATGSR